jgi:hypothetical protein
MAKISKILFVVGLAILVLGIVLVVVSPSLTKISWEPKIISTEQTLGVLARFKETKNEKKIDEVISVKPYYWEFLNKWDNTYDFYFSFPPLIFGGAKNIVVKGTAVEQSSPPRNFNFYIFNGSNFDLWKENLSSKAYYKGTGASSYSFNVAFNKKEELSFYFVVEVPKNELNPSLSPEELKRVVKVSDTISYVEVTERLKFEYENYYLWFVPLINISEVRNTVLEGSVKESSNNNFNFYVFDGTNFENFDSDKPYSSCYEKKGISEDSFSVPLKPEQANSNIYFVVVNTSNYNESMVLKAKISYEEKVVDASASVGAFFLGGALAGLGFVLVIIAGVSTLIFKPKEDY